ncbi:MAG: MBL fold metallo-hydrolase, partial [Thermoanaerobaculia bacterium]|nr:MBL fold metallo-hydrolase [Thermoanaerobaculia bacterium]
AFDAYASSQGAAWVAEQAKALTGRLPTDVVLSHHHGDHTAGLAGFAAAGDPPRVWLTEPMRERLRSGRPPAGAEAMLEEAAIVATSAETRLDLGGSNLVLRPLSGHTPSDVVATIGDRVTFCGDLIWNRLFPNYVDATPIELGRSVDALLEAHSAVRVPGHGPLFAEGELATYRRVLAEVEAAARAAHQAGTPAAEAAQAFSLPGSLGTWTLFSPSYFEVAFRAWHRQLAG